MKSGDQRRVLDYRMHSPVQVTPDQIITYGKAKSRSLHLEVNVIAYFGQILCPALLTVRPSVTAGSVLRLLPK